MKNGAMSGFIALKLPYKTWINELNPSVNIHRISSYFA
jgi:hypothetical protein